MKLDTFGTFDGEQVRGGTLKFSGTRGADRIVHEGEEVYFLAKIEGGWTKFSRDSHGDLIREMGLRIVAFEECPTELVETVATTIRTTAEDRAGLVPLPLDEADDADGEVD
jgi:hypothetical protein